MAWRIPFIIQIILAAILAISCLTVLPSSPRWLVLNYRYDEALRAVERLNIPRVEAEKDILVAPVDSSESGLGGFGAIILIFRRQYRARTILALFVLGMVQLSGIDGVLYVSLRASNYSTHLLTQVQVRTHPLFARRTSNTDRRLPCLRGLRHPHARHLNPRSDLRRRLAPPYQHHHRGHTAVRLHVPNRHTVRREPRTPTRRGPLDRRSLDLHLRTRLYQYLGCRRQDLCL